MTEIIKPQPGGQEKFLSSPADIVIYGGAAGAAKTFSLLMEPLRHIDNPKFSCTIFRKTTPQIKSQGGLYDTALQLYSKLGAVPRDYQMDFTFPSGMRVKLAHLEDDSALLGYQGSQIPLIELDELTHFTEKQFWYLLSRNRSTSGVPGYIRASTNPDADSFVRRLIDWWIGPDGFPIKERSGVIRYFIRLNDQMIWGDTKEELTSIYGEDCLPKSFTFISASIFDNQILLKSDPGYLANLKALNYVDREQLLMGNWNIKPIAGNFFKRDWFEIIDALPGNVQQSIRAWDRAATKPSPTNPDPDWTAGLKLEKYPNNIFVVSDVKRLRDTPLQVEQLIKNTATQDGYGVRIVSQQDPGSAGVQEANSFTRLLSGYTVHTRVISKDKVTRAKAVSAQAEAGNIKILRGAWNEDFFKELERFPDRKGHDDQVDVLSLAFNESTQSRSILDAL